VVPAGVTRRQRDAKSPLIVPVRPLLTTHPVLPSWDLCVMPAGATIGAAVKAGESACGDYDGCGACISDASDLCGW